MQRFHSNLSIIMKLQRNRCVIALANTRKAKTRNKEPQS